LLPIDIQLRVGSVRNGFGGDVYEVEQVETHPLFEQIWFTAQDYDVGVIKTIETIVFGGNVSPTKLPVKNAELPVKTPVTVSGWGRISVSTIII